jgi:arsenate reductase
MRVFSLNPPEGLKFTAACSLYTNRTARILHVILDILLLMKAKVLFVCTGNAVRSQMAEGWARHLHGDWLEAHSAGTKPKGLDPSAVLVMSEAGMDISHHRSKHVSVYEGWDFDLAVTVCDNAKEACPIFPAKRTIHAGFADPSEAAGDAGQRLDAYRACRDEIKAFVETLPGLMKP